MFNKSYHSQEEKNIAGGLSQSLLSGRGFVVAISGAVNYVIASMAIPARLFMRTDFGERSIPPFGAVVMIAIHIGFMVKLYFWVFLLFERVSEKGIEAFPLIVTPLLPIQFYLPLIAYLLLICYMLIKHFRGIIDKVVNNNIEYSFFRGRSKFYTYFEDEKVKLFSFQGEVIHSLTKHEGNKKNVGVRKIPLILRLKGIMTEEELMGVLLEPKAVIITGFKFLLITFILSASFYLIANTGPLFAIWVLLFGLPCLFLILSGICLFIDELTIFLQRRGNLLDIHDGEYELSRVTNYKTELLNRENDSKTESDRGFEIVVTD